MFMALIFDPSELLSIRQAARQLGVSYSTVRRAVQSKLIESYKIGGFVYLHQSEVDRLQRLRAPGQEALTRSGGVQ